MTKNKYATVDFDQVNEKGLKSLIAAINKTGVTVIEVDSSNRATTKMALKLKPQSWFLTTDNSCHTGKRYWRYIVCELNGKAIPNAQSPDIKTWYRHGASGPPKTPQIPNHDRQSETCCQSGRQETGSKIQLSAPARGKTRNAQVVAAYNQRRTRCLSINSRSLICGRSWIRRQADSITKGPNGELKRRLKQLKAGN
ncbi:hypothetical protein CSC22_5222 (plasmid) [Escherichia coli]|nr:odaE [Escherichia coli]AWF23751.1 hypothetical protein CSC22_5222 [Escherichia coli]